MTRAAGVPILVVCAVALGACGAKTLAKGDVEKQSAAAIAKLVRDPVTATKCPGGLDATVGKSETCTMTFQSGRVVEVTATVTSVEGSDARFDVKVTKIVKP